jgi:predicted TIM-barrel fold metal-dependent hydrolase
MICGAGASASAQAQYIGHVAQRHPDIDFILSHIVPGQDSHTTVLTILEHENVYVEISRSMPYEFRDVLRAVGADRVLFGSDPQGASWIEAVYLYMVRKHGLPPDQERLVLGENAKKIFRLKE